MVGAQGENKGTWSANRIIDMKLVVCQSNEWCSSRGKMEEAFDGIKVSCCDPTTIAIGPPRHSLFCHTFA